MSKEEADENFEKWKSEFLGDSTKIRRALSTEKPNRAVIIKKAPLDVNDEMIQSCLDAQFKDAKATRFIKRDSTKQLKLCWDLKTILEKLCIKGFSTTLSVIKQYISCKMGYRLSDASNARSLVTSMPNVNQVRNVDTAVKIIC